MEGLNLKRLLKSLEKIIKALPKKCHVALRHFDVPQVINASL